MRNTVLCPSAGQLIFYCKNIDQIIEETREQFSKSNYRNNFTTKQCAISHSLLISNIY